MHSMMDSVPGFVQTALMQEILTHAMFGLSQLARRSPATTSRAAIEALPEAIISLADVADGLACHVCLESFVAGEKDVAALPCRHRFHRVCITPWLTSNSHTCPVCRAPLPTEQNEAAATAASPAVAPTVPSAVSASASPDSAHPRAGAGHPRNYFRPPTPPLPRLIDENHPRNYFHPLAPLSPGLIDDDDFMSLTSPSPPRFIADFASDEDVRFEMRSAPRPSLPAIRASPVRHVRTALQPPRARAVAQANAATASIARPAATAAAAAAATAAVNSAQEDAILDAALSSVDNDAASSLRQLACPAAPLRPPPPPRTTPSTSAASSLRIKPLLPPEPAPTSRQRFAGMRRAAPMPSTEPNVVDAAAAAVAHGLDEERPRRSRRRLQRDPPEQSEPVVEAPSEGSRLAVHSTVRPHSADAMCAAASRSSRGRRALRSAASVAHAVPADAPEADCAAYARPTPAEVIDCAAAVAVNHRTT